MKAYNWDGSDEANPSVTTILPLQTFTINSLSIENLGDGFDGSIFIEGGILEVNTAQFDEVLGVFVTAPWRLDDGAEMHLNNSKFFDETITGVGAVVRGAPIDVAGRVVGNGADNHIETELLFRPSTQLEVADEEDELFLDAATEYRGGSYTGAGVLHQIGDALFQLDTSILNKVYDWDGDEANPSTTTIGSGRTVWLRPESIDTDDNGFDGLIQIHQGTLIVNTLVHGPMVVNFLPWLLDVDGTINLFDHAVISGTGNPIFLNQPTGSRMLVAGQINATDLGNVIYSPTTFQAPAAVTVNAASSLDLVGPTIYEGGSYVGDGLLSQSGDAHVVAPTTIGVATFDFDGNSEATTWTLDANLTLNVRQVDVIDNIFNGTILAPSDATLTVNIGNGDRWDMLGTIDVGSPSADPIFHIAGTPVKVAGAVNVQPDASLVFDADANGNFIVTGGGKVIFNGANNPGNSPGVEQFEGDVEFSSSAVLVIELGDRFDRLLIDGHVTLGGTLHIEVLGDFAPEPGERFTILTYGSRNGTFDSVTGSILPEGLFIAQDYDDGELSLVVALAGDFDGDGDRDGADFLKWQLGESPNPLSQSDLDDWQENFTNLASAMTAASTEVPEPSTGIMLIIGMVTLLTGGRTVVSKLIR